MGVQGDRIFAEMRQRGFPAPWSDFGECLSWESAYSVQLKQAIETARAGTDPHSTATVDELFRLKVDNLTAARKLLGDVLAQYDQSGMWRLLDERAARLDIEDVSERWARGLVEHPFPIGLLSLQFNWRYMKQHGVRAFYEMTSVYVDDLLANTHRWAEAWKAETETGVIDRLTTVECDLASEEAPMHCDICQKTIAALIYLRE
ncbi:hypothetical protein Acsp03_34070 [Actinomadura sp. NBRC 104412]|uniref:hypothetical protein n=1 Tax=Actinomadura sp. NBRC 104412 TaxID=3032203 RepID=UPI0024A4B113|nr:hypothetical protein [Actinomadura sp. NBRC 104412]GLZ05941.1 hypothetical protein Acsp03_34070 [Actinomadura sp. NBRC 104412]